MRLFTLFILIALTGCGLNRKDSKGLKQGRWVLYYDEQQKQCMWKGRYKNGEQTGKWTYYTPTGKKYLTEKYMQERIWTTYYDSLQRKQLQGYANYIETEDTAYYRWEGNWYHFDNLGQVDKISFYKMGKFAWFVPVPKSKSNRK
jgi:antitoxin component YwqK of YwqJK toxin-antitoxin module